MTEILSLPLEQGKKLFAHSTEEKLTQNKGLISFLRGNVHNEMCTLGVAQKVPTPPAGALLCQRLALPLRQGASLLSLTRRAIRVCAIPEPQHPKLLQLRLSNTVQV